jgi:hypothetical protein
MMTDGDVSARESAASAVPARDDRVAGQSVIAELLRVQDNRPQQAPLARLWGANPLTREGQSWYRAALGEISVGDALGTLGPEWIVLHAVPVGEGTADIDHVVIGPGGVFIVNTTSHPGLPVWASQRTFMVADIRYPFIRNMEYEMGRAERLLSTAAGVPVEVSGILAVVEPKSLTVREPHRDVAVLHASTLVRWLVGRKRVLSAAQVAAIGDAAKGESTWHTSDSPVDDPRKLRERFELLRRQVTRAWHVQMFWATTATVIGAGAFIAVTYTILLSALRTFGI